MKSSPATIRGNDQARFWAAAALTTVGLQFGIYILLLTLAATELIEPIWGVGLFVITAIGARIGTRYCNAKLERLSSENSASNHVP